MHIISRSASQTLYIGRIIARNLKAGDIIGLFGKLGAGKTVLTKGIVQGLGILRRKVSSPSFVLIRPHLKGRLPLYHFDLYRLKSPKDILGLGYEEFIYGEAVTVIEWAERLKYLQPKELLKIELFIKDKSKRELKFTAKGQRYKELLKKIRQEIK